MIDILVYLFENYLPDACPEPAVLARKLSAAGFETDDISAALSWLDGLAGEEGGRCRSPAASSAVRIYDEEEQERLPAPCRGFIAFLEQHDAVDAPLREAIIERALALPDAVVSLDRLKVIVLAVIWRYRHEVDALILEELLAEDSDGDDSSGGENLTRILLN
jgi:Smg protein